MSDEERGARLAELAQMAHRAWPDETGTSVRRVAGKALAFGASGYQLVGIGSHPRALDALEAALMTLADPEAKTITRKSFAEAVEQAAAKLAESRAELDAKLREMVGEAPAWVEQLASELEDRAQEREGHVRKYRRDNAPQAAAYAEGVMDAERGCAAELRERAKGGGT